MERQLEGNFVNKELESTRDNHLFRSKLKYIRNSGLTNFDDISSNQQHEKKSRLRRQDLVWAYGLKWLLKVGVWIWSSVVKSWWPYRLVCPKRRQLVKPCCSMESLNVCIKQWQNNLGIINPFKNLIKKKLAYLYLV